MLRSWRTPLATLTVAAVVATAGLVAAAFAGPAGVEGALSLAPAAAAATPPSRTLMVQGTVVSVTGTTVTIETPSERPICKPGKACPMYILAGQSFEIDMSATTPVDNPDGISVGRSAIAVGDWLAAYGREALTPTTPISLVHVVAASFVDVSASAGIGPCGTGNVICPVRDAG
jgi:hypothetical protein